MHECLGQRIPDVEVTALGRDHLWQEHIAFLH
jgi:hypothetical protein